jgi:hypothetical protein
MTAPASSVVGALDRGGIDRQISSLQLASLVDGVGHLGGERTIIDLAGHRLDRTGAAHIHNLAHLGPAENSGAHLGEILVRRFLAVGSARSVAPIEAANS